MTPEQITRERAKFEAHIRSTSTRHKSDIALNEKGDYLWNETKRMWGCWLSRAEEAHRVREALERVLKSFPTDMDMHAAGLEQIGVDEACNAYDAARTALKDTE